MPEIRMNPLASFLFPLLLSPEFSKPCVSSVDLVCLDLALTLDCFIPESIHQDFGNHEESSWLTRFDSEDKFYLFHIL